MQLLQSALYNRRLQGSWGGRCRRGGSGGAKPVKGYDPATTEIAFFGGSFTAINRNYMTDLLEAAAVFVRDGSVRGIMNFPPAPTR